MRPRGDPRGAPPSIQKNTTIAESCEYYGVKDSVSQCRYPRSCSDCLAMTGCMLTGAGECVNATERFQVSRSMWEKDYHKSLPQQGSTAVPFSATTMYGSDTYNVFYAENATYCSASDPVCTACRAEFVLLAESHKTSGDIRSQFCVGTDGCVCIAMCEVPSKRNFYPIGDDCIVELPVFVKPKPLQSFTSRRRDPRAPLLNVLTQTQPATCYAQSDMDVQGCGRRRTCQECLSTSGCLVNELFVCAEMATYSPTRDYRKNLMEGSINMYRGGGQYPSTNTTYCSSSDTRCQQCREEFASKATQFRDWPNMDANAVTCAGENGCVCIEQCESDLWADYVRSLDSTCSTITHGDGVVLFKPLSVLTLVVIIVMAVVLSHKKKPQLNVPTRGRATLLLRHMLDQAPVFSRNLDLFGWRDYYATLREKERQLLRGEENVSPMSMPAVFDYEFVEATAPELEFDEDEEASAPTVADPRALASAPSFQARELVDAATPSAPELDEVLEPVESSME